MQGINLGQGWRRGGCSQQKMVYSCQQCRYTITTCCTLRGCNGALVCACDAGVAVLFQVLAHNYDTLYDARNPDA